MTVYNFQDLRPEPTYPIYPPYHKGKYLEDFVFDYYKNHREDFDKSGRLMIPVSWTTLYVQGTDKNIQEYLNALDQSKAYWTLSQHDDGIRHRRPPNTLHFGAGGLGGGIPIPLVCSPIQNLDYTLDPDGSKRMIVREKSIFCSFVGSITHPIRQQLVDYNKHQSVSNNTFFLPSSWNQQVSNTALEDFILITQASHFSLAPRGYGLSSFRLYEIMQLGSIPVYISDKHWLPWQDELNWEEFCVIITPNQIPNLYNILSNISEEKRQQMLEKIKEIYPKYFTLEAVAKNIQKRL